MARGHRDHPGPLTCIKTPAADQAMMIESRGLSNAGDRNSGMGSVPTAVSLVPGGSGRNQLPHRQAIMAAHMAGLHCGGLDCGADRLGPRWARACPVWQLRDQSAPRCSVSCPVGALVVKALPWSQPSGRPDGHCTACDDCGDGRDRHGQLGPRSRRRPVCRDYCKGRAADRAGAKASPPAHQDGA